MSCQFLQSRNVNLLENFWSQPCVTTLPPGKRPRQQEHVPGIVGLGDEAAGGGFKQHCTQGSHDTILKYALLFARWSKGLAKSHSNCKRIPVELVLRMAVRMVSHLTSKGVETSKETLATTFWVALKFYSSRDTIPNASFMGMVTKTTKHALIFNEPKVLEELGWDLYAFFKDP